MAASWALRVAEKMTMMRCANRQTRCKCQALGVEVAAATMDNVEAQAMLILSGAYAGFLRAFLDELMHCSRAMAAQE
ncbi:hypothetical protein ACFPU0_14720 [Pseudomonas sp. GCM10022186]|uniref:hypothetical protein n=1 Tax=Pseudomonas sp. GCM10022186 TaxID=3252650 RepID=UPI00360F15F6